MRLAEISVAKEHNEFDRERQALVATRASNCLHCAVVNNEEDIERQGAAQEFENAIGLKRFYCV